MTTRRASHAEVFADTKRETPKKIAAIDGGADESVCTSVSLMYARVLAFSMLASVLGWLGLFSAVIYTPVMGVMLERAQDLVCATVALFFLFAAAHDYVRLFVSKRTATTMTRHRDRFYVLCVSLVSVPLVQFACMLVYVYAADEMTGALRPTSQQLSPLALSHILPFACMLMELLCAWHRYSRNAFGDFMMIFASATTLVTWEILFKDSSGIFNPHHYLWELNPVASIGVGVGVIACYMAFFFLARLLSKRRWRAKREYEELIF